MTVDSIAQTNLQLINQLRYKGYTNKEIDTANKAYELAVETCSHLFRGSGKPLLSHLLGTASLLAESELPITVVLAGLLHAVPYDGDHGFLDPDSELKKIVGAEGYLQIHGYLNLNFKYESKQVRDFTSKLTKSSQVFRHSVAIRIANEIEDYLDGALSFYSIEGRKGVIWRCEHIRKNFPLLIEQAELLNYPLMVDRLESIISEVDKIDINNLKTSLMVEKNGGKQFPVIPKSYKLQYRVRIDRILKKIIARVKRKNLQILIKELIFK